MLEKLLPIFFPDLFGKYSATSLYCEVMSLLAYVNTQNHECEFYEHWYENLEHRMIPNDHSHTIRMVPVIVYLLCVAVISLILQTYYNNNANCQQ